MDDTEAQTRIAELSRDLEKHNRLYYVEASPSISDREYDDMHRELIDLEEKFPALRVPNSPSQRVGGAPIDGFVQIEHPVRMMSLDNTYSEEELVEFY